MKMLPWYIALVLGMLALLVLPVACTAQTMLIPADNPSVYENWHTEVIQGPITNRDQFEKIMLAVATRNELRYNQIIQIEHDQLDQAEEAFNTGLKTAYLALHDTDPEGARWWIEREVFHKSDTNEQKAKVKQPSSEAFKSFRAHIKAITETKKIAAEVAAELFECAKHKSDNIFATEMHQVYEIYFEHLIFI